MVESLSLKVSILPAFITLLLSLNVRILDRCILTLLLSLLHLF